MLKSAKIVLNDYEGSRIVKETLKYFQQVVMDSVVVLILKILTLLNPIRAGLFYVHQD